MEDSSREQVGYVDGCFDLMHSGHFNAILQAKKRSGKLVVGIHSNEEIQRHKGPPLMTQSERYEMLNHVKWVDEVAYDVPYSPSLEILDMYNCDKAFHGDDMPANSSGEGAYDVLRDAGRLEVFPRTEGLSTTDCIGRLMALAMATADSTPDDTPASDGECSNSDRYDDIDCENSNDKKNHHNDNISNATTYKSLLANRGVKILQSTKRIAEFSSPTRDPLPTDTVVYIDGTFDIYNIGHATTLEQAKKLGTYLIVGLYSDDTAKEVKGYSPICNLFERALCVLSCKHVDDVIMDVPIHVTEDMLTTMRVNIVAQGSQRRTHFCSIQNGKFVEQGECNLFTDPSGAYEIPKHRGMFVEIPSKYPHLNINTFLQRILSNQEAYVRRNTDRVEKEENYYREKHGKLSS